MAKKREEKIDLRPLGARVREARLALSLTQRELSDRAGLSLRFLSDLEAGQGNISIGRLQAVALALGMKLSLLVAPLDRRGASTERSAKTPRLEGPLALVGLRGAGKSAIGGKLSAVLRLELIELDEAIEAAAGLGLAQIFEIHGDAYYRRLEHERVSQLLKKSAPMVIAAGGGLVSHRETWSMLKQKARTVWLKARPEDHYRRVMAQGDLRPMENRPAAMAELRAILAARSAHYAEAELTVDTSALGLDGSVDRVLSWLAAQ